MKLKVVLVLVAISLKLSYARKYGIVVDERTENCAKPEEDAHAFNRSSFELIALSDMDVFMNGTIKITKKFRSPIPFHVYAEKFERSEWHLAALDTRRADFCTSMQNPTEVWYLKFQRLKGCPLNVGVSFAVKLKLLVFFSNCFEKKSSCWGSFKQSI